MSAIYFNKKNQTSLQLSNKMRAVKK